MNLKIIPIKYEASTQSTSEHFNRYLLNERSNASCGGNDRKINRVYSIVSYMWRKRRGEYEKNISHWMLNRRAISKCEDQTCNKCSNTVIHTRTHSEKKRNGKKRGVETTYTIKISRKKTFHCNPVVVVFGKLAVPV